MSNVIDKGLLQRAKEVFDAQGNDSIQSVGVTPSGMPFKTLAEAQRYADRFKQGEAVLITRADVEAEFAPAADVADAVKAYADMTVAELKAACDAKEIAYAKNASKAALVSLLKAAPAVAAVVDKVTGEATPITEAKVEPADEAAENPAEQ